MVSVLSEKTTGPLAGCIDALTRCKMAAHAIPKESFNIEGHSVGRHFRHCLEHATCLLDGLNTGAIRYDARARDREIERDRDAFLRATEQTIRRLQALTSEHAEQAIAVCQEADASGTETEMMSSVPRELCFVASHTIHHLAVIRLIAGQLGVAIPESVVLAFSTASHNARAASG